MDVSDGQRGASFYSCTLTQATMITWKHKPSRWRCLPHCQVFHVWLCHICNQDRVRASERDNAMSCRWIVYRGANWLANWGSHPQTEQSRLSWYPEVLVTASSSHTHKTPAYPSYIEGLGSCTYNDPCMHVYLSHYSCKCVGHGVDYTLGYLSDWEVLLRPEQPFCETYHHIPSFSRDSCQKPWSFASFWPHDESSMVQLHTESDLSKLDADGATNGPDPPLCHHT